MTLLLVLACSNSHESGIKVHNTAPTGSVLFPPEGAVLAADAALELTARASDDTTPRDELRVEWTSDVDGVLFGEQLVEGTENSTHIGRGLSEGLHTLTLTVIDGQGNRTTDSVVVDAVPNEAPTVDILSPGEGDLFGEGPFEMVVHLQDDFDNPDDLILLLDSTEEGNIPFVSTGTGANRVLSVEEGLAPADTLLTVTVFDSGGLGADAGVELVAERNEAPIVTILSPVQGASLGEVERIWVEVQIEDDSYDLTTIQLEWEGIVDMDWAMEEDLPSNPSIDGHVGRYLDVSGCTDPNYQPEYLLGVTAIDEGGLETTAQIGFFVECI